MDETLDFPLDPVRQRLFRAKLGNLATWQVPSILQTVGPYEPEVFEAFEKRRRELADAVRNRLRNYSDEQLTELTDGKRRDQPETLNLWRSFLCAGIEQLKHRIPPWYAGGLGHPDFAADFGYWCKMPSFSVAEVTILSVGVEPRHLEKMLIDKTVKRTEIERSWPALQFLFRRYDQLKRKFDPQSFGWKFHPIDFLAWAERVDFESSPQFLSLLKKYHSTAERSGAANHASNKPDRREIDSIVQLFAAMAIETYGYVPNQKRSPVPREIAEMAATMGLEISDDTVRKYLRRGASFIPSDWSPNDD